MLAAVEIAWVAAAQAAAVTGGLLQGIRYVIDTPPETAIAAQLYPVLEIFMDTANFGVFEGGWLKFHGKSYIRLRTQSADTLQAAKQELQRLLWSDDGTKGLGPFLAAHNGIKVNGQTFLLNPGDFKMSFAGGKPATFEAYAPITITTMV